MIKVDQTETNLQNDQKIYEDQQEYQQTTSFRFCLLSAVGIGIALFFVVVLFTGLNESSSRVNPYKRSSQIIFQNKSKKILISKILLNTSSYQNQTVTFENGESVQSSFKLSPNVFRTQSEYNQIIVEYKQKFLKHLIYFSDKFPADKASPFAEYGFDNSIQLASQFDYLNLTESSQYKQLEGQWHKILPHEIFNFPFNQQLERSQQLINITGRFKDVWSSTALVYQLAAQIELGCESRPMEACLALLLNKLNFNEDVKEVQYEIMDQLFQIGQIKDQSSICIVSPGYNTASLNNYIETFNSLERLNYTNFKFVIIDDNSPDQSVETFYNYFNGSNMRLRNRVTIVRNIVKVGMAGNLYLKIKQFCSGFDIVVNMDLDDALFGYQTLKVVNAIYQNPQVWISFSQLIQQWIGSSRQWTAMVRPIQQVNNDNYRTIEHYWFTIPLRSSRYALNAKLPLYHMAEYVYNKFTGYLEPTFYSSASDRFYDYSLFEMAGQKRTRKVQVFLYDYKVFNPINKVCYIQFEMYHQYKSRAKTPLQNLQDLNSKPQLFSNRPPTQSVLSSLRYNLHNYAVCQNFFLKPNQSNFNKQKFVYSVGSQNQQLFLSQQLLQQIASQLNCSQFTVLTRLSQTEALNTHPNIKRTINFLTMEQVEDSVRESNEISKQSLKSEAKHNCIVTKDFQINSLIFYYQGFSSLLIETTIYDILSYDVATFIGNQRLYENLNISKFEFGEKKYLKLTAI